MKGLNWWLPYVGPGACLCWSCCEARAFPAYYRADHREARIWSDDPRLSPAAHQVVLDAYRHLPYARRGYRP